MNEIQFRAVATAAMKEANRRYGKETLLGTKVLDDIQIDVLVSEAIKVAGKERIRDCPGPLHSFEEAVEYMGDVVFEQQNDSPVRYVHVIEMMWGMPNWLCVIEQGCWDCMREPYHEMGNRTTVYLRRETREYIRIRIDGLYAVVFKRSGARAWSEKSEDDAWQKAFRKMMDTVTVKEMMGTTGKLGRDLIEEGLKELIA